MTDARGISDSRSHFFRLKLSELNTQLEGRSPYLINWLHPQSPAQLTHGLPALLLGSHRSIATHR
ncbi:MAG: hypothetical protein KME43_19755 [Myxacorys chilensis ATA2-1-KO14]|nr:hypothetical protein [Myxacorys chilensis ATA2-1-KO14]